MQLKVPQVNIPYVRRPTAYTPNINAPIIDINSIMEHNAVEKQKQDVIARTPEVLTDPLLNLRVREYYRDKYSRTAGTEIGGRVVGAAEGALLGGAITSAVAALVVFVAGLVNPAPDEAVTIPALATAGIKLKTAITAGKAAGMAAAKYGAIAGATVGAATSDYTTFYATKDMLTNLYTPQAPGRTVLNALNFIGKSMDLASTTTIIKSTLYSMITGENPLVRIRKAYGLDDEGREDMDFSMIREALGIDLGGVANTIFDITGEICTDPGAVAGTIGQLATYKGARKAYIEAIEEVTTDVNDYVTKGANAFIKSGSKNIPAFINAIREGNIDDAIMILGTSQKAKTSTIASNAYKLSIAKLCQNINKSAYKSVAVRLNTGFKTIDFFDDMFTGYAAAVASPVIAGAKLYKKAKSNGLGLDFIYKLMGQEKFEKTAEFFQGNLKRNEVYDKTITRSEFGQMINKWKLAFQRGAFRNSGSKRVVSNYIKDLDDALGVKYRAYRGLSFAKIEELAQTDNVAKELCDAIKTKVVKTWDSINGKATKLTDEIVNLNKKLDADPKNTYIYKRIAKKKAELQEIMTDESYYNAKYDHLVITQAGSMERLGNSLTTIYTGNRLMKRSPELYKRYENKVNEAYENLVKAYMEGDEIATEYLDQLSSSIPDFIRKTMDSSIKDELLTFFKGKAKTFNAKMSELTPKYKEMFVNTMVEEVIDQITKTGNNDLLDEFKINIHNLNGEPVEKQYKEITNFINMNLVTAPEIKNDAVQEMIDTAQKEYHDLISKRDILNRFIDNGKIEQVYAGNVPIYSGGKTTDYGYKVQKAKLVDDISKVLGVDIEVVKEAEEMYDTIADVSEDILGTKGTDLADWYKNLAGIIYTSNKDLSKLNTLSRAATRKYLLNTLKALMSDNPKDIEACTNVAKKVTDRFKLIYNDYVRGEGFYTKEDNAQIKQCFQSLYDILNNFEPKNLQKTINKAIANGNLDEVKLTKFKKLEEKYNKYKTEMKLHSSAYSDDAIEKIEKAYADAKEQYEALKKQGIATAVNEEAFKKAEEIYNTHRKNLEEHLNNYAVKNWDEIEKQYTKAKRNIYNSIVEEYVDVAYKNVVNLQRNITSATLNMLSNVNKTKFTTRTNLAIKRLQKLSNTLSDDISELNQYITDVQAKGLPVDDLLDILAKKQAKYDKYTKQLKQLKIIGERVNLFTNGYDALLNYLSPAANGNGLDTVMDNIFVNSVSKYADELIDTYDEILKSDAFNRIELTEKTPLAEQLSDKLFGATTSLYYTLNYLAVYNPAIFEKLVEQIKKVMSSSGSILYPKPQVFTQNIQIVKNIVDITNQYADIKNIPCAFNFNLAAKTNPHTNLIELKWGSKDPVINKLFGLLINNKIQKNGNMRRSLDVIDSFLNSDWYSSEKHNMSSILMEMQNKDPENYNVFKKLLKKPERQKLIKEYNASLIDKTFVNLYKGKKSPVLYTSTKYNKADSITNHTVYILDTEGTGSMSNGLRSISIRKITYKEVNDKLVASEPVVKSFYIDPHAEEAMGWTIDDDVEKLNMKHIGKSTREIMAEDAANNPLYTYKTSREMVLGVKKFIDEDGDTSPIILAHNAEYDFGMMMNALDAKTVSGNGHIDLDIAKTQAQAEFDYTFVDTLKLQQGLGLIGATADKYGNVKAMKYITNTDLGKASKNIDVVYEYIEPNGMIRYILNGEEVDSLDGKLNKKHIIKISTNGKTGEVNQTFDGGSLHDAANDTEMMNTWVDEMIEKMYNITIPSNGQKSVTLDSIENMEAFKENALSKSLDSVIASNDALPLINYYNRLSNVIFPDFDGNKFAEAVKRRDEYYEKLATGDIKFNGADLKFGNAATPAEERMYEYLTTLINIDNSATYAERMTAMDKALEMCDDAINSNEINLFGLDQKAAEEIQDALKEIDFIDEAFSKKIGFITELRSGSEIGHFVKNRNKTAYEMYCTFKDDYDINKMCNFFNGRVDELDNKSIANVAEHINKHINDPEYAKIKAIRDDLNKLRNAAYWNADFLERCYNTGDLRLLDIMENIARKLQNGEHIYDIREYVEKRFKTNGFKRLQAIRLVNEYIENYKDVSLLTSDNINALYSRIKQEFISVIKRDDVIVAQNDLAKNNVVMSNATDIDEMINNAFDTMRLPLRNAKATNRMYAKDPFTLAELNDMSILTEDDYKNLSNHGYFKFKDPDLRFEDGYMVMQPAQATRWNSDRVVRFDTEVRKGISLKYELNNIMDGLGLFTNSERKLNLPIVANNNKLLNIFQQIGDTFGIDLQTVIRGMTNKRCTRYIKEFTEQKGMYYDTFNFILNGGLESATFDSIEYKDILALFPMLYSIKDNFAYMDADKLTMVVKGVIAEQAFTMIKKYHGEAIDFAQDLNPKLRGVVNTYYDNFRVANQLFEDVKAVFTNIYGAINVDGFYNYMKRHPEYILCQITNDGKLVRLNELNKGFLSKILAEDDVHFQLMDRSSFIGITNKIQPIIMKGAAGWLRASVLRTMKILGLVNLNFMFQNTGAAIAQNTTGAVGKINIPKTIDTMVRTANDYGKYKKVMTQIISSKALDDFAGDFDAFITEWYKLLDDTDFLEVVAKKDPELYKTISKLTKEDKSMLEEMCSFTTTEACYGEINSSLMEDLRDNVEIKNSKQAQQELMDLGYTEDDILKSTPKDFKQKIVGKGVTDQADIDELLDKKQEACYRMYQRMSTQKIQEMLTALSKAEDTRLLRRYEYKRRYVLQQIIYDRQQRLSSAITRSIFLKKYFDVNNDLETIFRVSGMKLFIENGYTFDAAANEVIARHFLYSNKSLAEQYAEFLIPFVSYPMRMASFLIDHSNDSTMVQMLYHIDNYLWEDEQSERSDYLMRRRAKGDIPVGDTLVSIGAPYKEAMLSLTNPIYTMNSKLNPLVKPAVDAIVGSKYVRWNQIPVISQGNNIYSMIQERNLFASFTNDYYRYSSYGNYYMPRARLNSQGNLYNKLYTYNGFSRVAMNMKPLDSNNLKYRVNSILKYNGPKRYR